MILRFFFSIFLLNASAALGDEPVKYAIYASGSATTYLHAPYCATSGDRHLSIDIHFNSLTHALDEKRALAAAYRTMNARDYWMGSNYCGFARVGSDDFSVSLNGYFQGDLVTEGSFNIYERTGPEDVVYTPLVTDLKNTALGDLVDRVFGDEFRGSDNSFRFEPALDTARSAEAAIASRDLADYYYLVGQLAEWKFSDDWRNDRIIPKPTKKFPYGYVGPEAEEHYERASDLGHPIATLNLGASHGLKETLHRISYNASQGISPVITSEVRKDFAENSWLYSLGLAQRVGLFETYRVRFEELGVDVSETRLGVADDAPPNPIMIEKLVNARYCENYEAGATLLSQLAPSGIADMLGDVLSCEGDWIVGAAGSVRFRFAVRTAPDCAPVSNGETSCAFTAKVVYDINIAGTEAHKMLADLVIGDTNLLPASGRFMRAGDLWEIDGPLDIGNGQL